MVLSEYKENGYEISIDKSKLDIDLIHDYLCHRSYWAQGRSREVVNKSIDNSFCLGVYWTGQQVGFARVVTDFATFAWLCDFFILETHRGKGLGVRLLKAVVVHPEMQRVKMILLATADAHELYRRYGDFKQLEIPDKWMIRRNIAAY
jgi:GNAT superfamily N-acetyltransferase